MSSPSTNIRNYTIGGDFGSGSHSDPDKPTYVSRIDSSLIYVIVYIV